MMGAINDDIDFKSHQEHFCRGRGQPLTLSATIFSSLDSEEWTAKTNVDGSSLGLVVVFM